MPDPPRDQEKGLLCLSPGAFNPYMTPSSIAPCIDVGTYVTTINGTKAHLTRLMRNAILWVAAGAFVCFVFSSCATSGGGLDTVPLEDVVKEVKREVKDYQDKPVPSSPLPRLDTAEFTFKVVRTVSGGLSVNVFVIEIGGSHSREAMHTVTYTYKVPPPEKKFAARERPGPERKDSLAETIRRAAEAAKAATSFGDLPLNEMEINIEFVVKRQRNVAVKAPISIVTVGASVSGEKSTTQSVKLVFGRPTPTPAPAPE
jgi:hypothetical protein